MPVATSSASVLPLAPAACAARRRCASQLDTPVSDRYATAAPIGTSAVPPNAWEPVPASSKPSSVASMARKASRPMVSAITTRSPVGGMRRIHGSQSMPSAIGITPT